MKLPDTPIHVIEQAQQGDPLAWDRLFRDWHRVVLWRCRALGCGSADPEDVACIVFQRLFQKLKNLRDPKTFSAYLYGIILRVTSEHRRSTWGRRWAGSPERPLQSGAPSPAQQVASRRDVKSVLEALPERYQVVLVLCDGEGLTREEAAEAVGIAVNTVKSRLNRAREAFRTEARKRGMRSDV